MFSMAISDEAGGNVTEFAEFNVWQDAEAFKEVIDFAFDDIMFVTWDASLGDAVLHEDEIRQIREMSDLGRFCMDSNVTLMKLNRARFQEDILDMADPAAMCAALYPECIEECHYCHLDVDLEQGEHYGFVSIVHNSDEHPSAKLCTRLNTDLYMRYIHEHLK